MTQAQWKRWVLLGLLAGAVPLAGCRPRMEEGPRHREPEVRDPAQQALPLNRPGTGGSGDLTTGGVMTFPGSQGQPVLPGMEQDTSTSVPPTHTQGGPSGAPGTAPGGSPDAARGR